MKKRKECDLNSTDKKRQQLSCLFNFKKLIEFIHDCCHEL